MVEARTGKGYRLTRVPDLLLPVLIQPRLKTERLGRVIQHFPQIESTNTKARELAEQGAAEGTLVVAEYQTRGKGRMSRPWESPAGQNLLFSIILRPNPAPPGDLQPDPAGFRGPLPGHCTGKPFGREDKMAQRPLLPREKNGRDFGRIRGGGRAAELCHHRSRPERELVPGGPCRRRPSRPPAFLRKPEPGPPARISWFPLLSEMEQLYRQAEREGYPFLKQSGITTR